MGHRTSRRKRDRFTRRQSTEGIWERIREKAVNGKKEKREDQRRDLDEKKTDSTAKREGLSVRIEGRTTQTEKGEKLGKQK